MHPDGQPMPSDQNDMSDENLTDATLPPDADPVAEEGAPSALPVPRPDGGPTPMHAIAEALRLNAEALRRIDQNQRRISDSVEKGDRATQVVASTKALNETFRGLSEIQRGLLDAVVQQKGSGGRGVGFAFLAIALLACLLGFLLYDRVTSGNTVSREVYEGARTTAEERATEIGALKAAEGEARARQQEHRDSLASGERSATEARLALAAAERRVRDLEEEIESKEAQLKNYLAVKDLADSAGSLQLQNMQLQRETTDLRARLASSEREREGLYAMLAEHKIEERLGDPAAIKKVAEEMGVLPPSKGPSTAPQPLLSSRDKRKVRMQLNRLLGQAPGEEIYEILDFGDLEPGGTLRNVKVGRYLNQQMLNSLTCKELEILCVKDQDMLELRFKDGAIVNTRNPAERIPFSEGLHSVFIEKLGLAAWLEEAGRDAVIAPDGKLTWKSAPS